MTALPPSLDRRPKWKGFPVPYSVPWENGVPDFKGTDPERWVEIVRDRLCALCGDPIHGYVTFLGGPLCLENRLFFDGPMHEPCAKAAMELCPFVMGRKGYSPATSKAERVSPIEAREAPVEMHLFYSPGFRLVEVAGTPMIQSAPYLHHQKVPANHGKARST